MSGQSIGVVKKVNGEVFSLDWANTVTLDGVSAVQMPFGPMDVQAYKTDGVDLLISLNSGDVVTIENFFTEFGEDEEISELVLKDEQGVLWRGQFDPMTAEFNFTEIAALDAGADIASGALLNMPDWAMLGLAVFAIGGGAVAVHNSGSSSSSSNGLAPSAPGAPTEINLTDAVVTGKAAVGLTVQITDAEDKVLGKEVIVDKDGNFKYTLDELPKNGESIFITVKNSAGLSSERVEFVNPGVSSNKELAADDVDVENSIISADTNYAKTAVVDESIAFDFSVIAQPAEFDLFDDATAALGLAFEDVLSFSDNEQLGFFNQDEDTAVMQTTLADTRRDDTLDMTLMIDSLDDMFEQQHFVI